MTTNVFRTICEGLNAEPFSQNLTPAKLDSQTPEKLLQNLSDVVEWIQGNKFIDIRSENPDETAIRILNALRLFKYPPPRDIDQIQKWRLEILEGQKSSVHAVLNWIFENVDRLKERVYLAKYLTKIDVQTEAQSPEVSRLEHLVSEKMEEFKSIHSQIVESRGDFLRAEDVRNDLKTMEEEKEQLTRKIERSRRKLARCNDLEKRLEIAAKLHAEAEHQEELQIQHQEQHNALVHAGQRLTRLERALGDVEREKDLTKLDSIIENLKREVEVGDYLLNEKLHSNIATQKTSIQAIQKILSMKNVDNNDIIRIKEKIDKLNAEINEINEQNYQKSDPNEDKLIVYRHQDANVQRKKANVANSLQDARHELENIESILSNKRRELTEKSGKDEIVSSVQYKLYVKKLRNKSNYYKQKKAELEQAKAEIQILERTVELLVERLDEFREQCKIEGRGFIENINEQKENQLKRPQTAKPLTTNVKELKKMTEHLNSELTEKRSIIQRISDEINEFYQEHKEQNENFYAGENEAKIFKAKVESDRKQFDKEMSELNSAFKTEQDELIKTEGNAEKLEWFVKNLGATNQHDVLLQDLEQQNNELSRRIIELTNEIERAERDEKSSSQLVMWDSLVKIYRLKVGLQQQKREDEKQFGDNILY